LRRRLLVVVGREESLRLLLLRRLLEVLRRWGAPRLMERLLLVLVVLLRLLRERPWRGRLRMELAAGGGGWRAIVERLRVLHGVVSRRTLALVYIELWRAI
jgi:hypothetical protein